MNKEFEKICRMPQKSLKNHVKQKLQMRYEEVIVDDGFVYAQGSFPVLLVAHLDTVHSKLPNMILYDKDQNIVSSPNGIGGDDRCGVFCAIRGVARRKQNRVIKKFFITKILFANMNSLGKISTVRSIIQNVTLWIVCFCLLILRFEI